MGRFEPTRRIEINETTDLPWRALLGKYGASDGSAGAKANVPSALSVLRQAALYAQLPGEIDEAFAVVERHAVGYPVSVAVLPFLFDLVAAGSAHAARLTDAIAEIAKAPLDAHLRERLVQTCIERSGDIWTWLGVHDRAAAALAIHVPALRVAYLASIRQISAIQLLAMVELGEPAGVAGAIAHQWLESGDDTERMCAATFLARFADPSPALATRIDAALPPSAPAALAKLVGNLWSPAIQRPAVAPRMCDAEVVFAGEKLVLVKAGDRTVTVPWVNANVVRGDRLKVGITAHGQARIVVMDDGSVPFAAI